MQFWLTILGAILAISGGFLEKACARRKERESLRAALRSEIQAILAIVERRDYIAGLSKFIEAIKGGEPGLYQIRVGRSYDIVFTSNCSKLGLLPSETAEETVRFYFLVSSVREDLVLLQDACKSDDLQTRYGLNTKLGNLAFHEQMLRLSIETVALGNHLVQRLA
jgi:plasmid maintenance system killer protein